MKTFPATKLAEYFKIKVPSDGYLTNPFGATGQLYTNLGWMGHNGYDYSGDQKKVFAPFNGTVHKVRQTASKSDPWWISIWSDQEAEIEGQRVRLQVTLIHCDEFYIKEGDHVTKDQIIAKTDNTGYPVYSYGPHLHFGIYPLYWTGLSWADDKLNGYDGAVDPNPFFSGWIFDMDKYPEKTLVKGTDSPKVYLIEGRKKRWFPSQGAFWLSGRAFRASDIWNLAPFEVAQIPNGENMSDYTPEAKKEIASYYPDLLK